MTDGNEIEIFKEILNGNRKRFPRFFWDDREKAKSIFKYLIEEVLKLEKEQVITNLNYPIISKYKLTSPFDKYYNKSIGNVVNDIYPDLLEGKRIPHSEQTRIKISYAQKNLPSEKREKITIGSRLKYKDKEYIKKISDTKLGETNPKHKLKTEQVREIKKLWVTGIYTTTSLGEKYNISRQSIADIVYGRTWKDV